MLTLVGLSTFILCFGGMLWSNSRRWRYLARSYAKDMQRPAKKRSMQSAVLYGQFGYNSLKGILSIGAHRDGVSFRIMAPFSLFHAPLFIPYRDIRGWKATWYLDSPSVELEFASAPEIKMIMPAEQAEWIKSYSGQQMAVRDSTPPHGEGAAGWHTFAVVSAGISLIMMVWLVWQLLIGQRF